MKRSKHMPLGELKDRSEDEAWRAVMARDRSADGEFVFGVRTTGIFCTPSCAARRPKRANVVFFATPSAAERAGFRQCKRCNPVAPHTRTTTEKRIAKAVEYLGANAERRVSLGELSGVVGLSPFHLQRNFKAIVGVSPKRYQDAKRAERLKKQLRSGETVSRATYGAGYGSSRGAYEASKRLGVTPGVYRRGGEGLQIQYTIMPSTLGRVLVASTPRGVCAVTIGDDDAALEAELHDEFPKAETRKLPVTNPNLRGAVRSVQACIDGKSLGSPALDLQGTPFQVRVWEALRQIPTGETRTYRDIASAIGSDTAARAVGSACANNRVALLVPCHRAVRGDGGHGGYRWGIDRKRALLLQEKKKSRKRRDASRD
jgi:AraC family transcriptional regulator, regulatory protein of adaptative response / methylated-DNA-[protein]-cysteine methyltransferase